MRVEVAFQDDQLDFDLPDDRVIGAWHGPPRLAPAEVEYQTASALEVPLDYPPLRQAVVPGDRVVIPLDPGIPDAYRILEVVYSVLRGAGVTPETIQVLSPRSSVAAAEAANRHDPEDRGALAYLATTSQGRRVYLNRMLTDADFVLPIGRLGFDPVLGYRGPWSLIYPALSDEETLRAYRTQAIARPPDRDADVPALNESAEVSWLLGSQFHIGVVEGQSGVSTVLAGRDERVRDEGKAAVDAVWLFRAEDRADVVVAGIGGPGQTADLHDLVQGLETAMQLVRRGGKIVALSCVGGPLGPAMQRLVRADDPRSGPAVLRGLEGEPDYATACRLARVLTWADVYLFSSLDEQDVEGLSMIALAKPAEARRLVAAASSSIFVSGADRTRAMVAGEAD
jgi:hypothetical protein